jgi:hypothetical protein
MSEQRSVYRIYYEPSDGWVVMDWDGYATSAQFREGTELMLKTLLEHGAHKVLADARDMILISQEDQKWLENSFLPRAIDRGFKAVALIKPVSYFNAVAIESVSYKVHKRDFLIRIFDNQEEARDWLRQVAV